MPQIAKSKKKFLVVYTEAAKVNLKLQQSRYMKKHGVKINQQELGGLLLETATLK